MFRATSGTEKFPRNHYQELVADYEERFGTGEDNPFRRTHFNAEAGEYQPGRISGACYVSSAFGAVRCSTGR